MWTDTSVLLTECVTLAIHMNTDRQQYNWVTNMIMMNMMWLNSEWWVWLNWMIFLLQMEKSFLWGQQCKHLVQRRRFERGPKESIYIKPERLRTEEVAKDITYHPPTELNCLSVVPQCYLAALSHTEVLQLVDSHLSIAASYQDTVCLCGKQQGPHLHGGGSRLHNDWVQTDR